MSYERCDVVYGADPFKSGDYARPWLVISNRAHPFQGDQYIVLALTTRTWHDGLVDVHADEWIEGGPRNRAASFPGASKRWTTET